jgi:hypothetical protein
LTVIFSNSNTTFLMDLLKRINAVGFYKLKIENRNHIVSKLKTGDTITTKSKLIPLYIHHGIIERIGDEVFIVHLHPDKINSSGGNLVKEHLSKWLVEGREIVSIQETNLDSATLDQLYKDLKSEKYDHINYNCEHFVNFAKGDYFVSRQVVQYTGILLIGAFVYYLIRNKKI